ncbi:putative aromatic desulfoglucosinolate sulfotransferase [Helianthus anomalus]
MGCTKLIIQVEKTMQLLIKETLKKKRSSNSMRSSARSFQELLDLSGHICIFTKAVGCLPWTHECFPVVDLFQSTYYPISDTEDHLFPRLFASHFAHNVLPASITDPSSGCKFVYVCRDPKDVLIATWHFILKMTPKELPKISLDQVFQMFCGGVMEYGPYWDHVLGFWKAALESPDNILFFKYEEIKRDPEAHVKKLAEFMGVPILVQEEDNGMVKKVLKKQLMHNVQVLRHKKTQTIYPLHGSSSTLHFFNFFTRIYIWTIFSLSSLSLLSLSLSAI